MKCEYLNEGYDDFSDWEYDDIREEIVKSFGQPNRYSGSADWGGATVWSISGDKFVGMFLVIDDNNDVALIDRKLNGDDGYEDEEISVARNFEELWKLIADIKSELN